MKSFALAAFVAATFAAPLALPSDADARDRRGDRHRDWDRDRDRDRDWRRDRGRDRHYRDSRRDSRRDYNRWDRSRYNGYWHSGRWYYGPPPAHYRDVRYEWRQWRRGDRLPSYYRDYYRPVDYRHYRLRPPPRGYHYVRDDRGNYLLIGIATGVILGVILAGG